MSEPVLVAYASADRAGFAALVNDIHAEYGFSFDPALDADLADPAAFYPQVWVLKAHGTVIGSVALTAPSDGVMTLKRMYLRPAYRGKGWSRALLTTAIRSAQTEGCVRVELDTTDAQCDAIRLYESFGFELYHRSGGTRFYARLLNGFAGFA